MNPKLVLLSTYLTDPIIDLRYASTHNIARRVLYESGHAPKLTVKAAHALASAESFFIERGFRLVVWDANRPAHVQKQLRQINNDDLYVLEKSHHVDGAAIDVTLANRDGSYLDMGTDFDDFTPRAHADFKGLSNNQFKNRKLLLKGMQQAHFTQWPYEWWHFDYLQ